MGSGIESAYVAAGIVFAGTELIYFFSNLGILSLYLTPSNMVPERERAKRVGDHGVMRRTRRRHEKNAGRCRPPRVRHRPGRAPIPLEDDV